MVEEIDLRPYLAALIRHWKWVVGATIITALIAFITTSLLPPTYEAKVLIAITNSQQIVLSSLITENFDPRFNDVNQGTPPFKAYPEIAVSDELLQSVLLELTPPLEEIKGLEDLRKHIEIELGQDQSILYLVVHMDNPQDAERLANLWGELFINWANQIYGTLDSRSLSFFESQLEQVGAELETAENALIDFQAHNTTILLDNQLTSLQVTHGDYLASQRAIATLLEDIQIIRAQVSNQSDGNSITFADQLTALSLQLKAFNAEAGDSLQFQIDAVDPIVFSSRDEQIAFWDGLTAVLTTKSTQIESLLAELEPKILTLQQEKQIIQTEQGQLIRARDVAQETYTALTRKIAEERITTQDSSSGVKLASRSAMPEEPISSGRLLNTLVAGSLGLVLAILVVFVTQWQQWQSK